MRTIETITNDVFTITIFDLNEKYVVKLEGGPIEQVFKLKKESVKGLDGLKQILDQHYLDRAREIHNELFLNLKESLERNS